MIIVIYKTQTHISVILNTKHYVKLEIIENYIKKYSNFDDYEFVIFEYHWQTQKQQKYIFKKIKRIKK